MEVENQLLNFLKPEMLYSGMVILGILSFYYLKNYISSYAAKRGEQKATKTGMLQRQYTFNDLMKHSIFSTISLAKNQLMYLEFPCNIRRTILMQAMEFLFDEISNEFSELIKMKNINVLSKEEFANLILMNTLKYASEHWLERCKSDRIPEFVSYKISKNINRPLRNLIKEQTMYIAYTDYFYYDNVNKLWAIMSCCEIMIYSLLQSLELTLNDINGDFIGISYKNLKCPGLGACKANGICQKYIPMKTEIKNHEQ